MKRIHLYEAKLIDGSMRRGEIVHKDDKKIRFRLTDGQIMLLYCKKIMLIRDLGWHKQEGQN